MEAKMTKVYYSPSGFWKGYSAVKKLSSAAGVSEAQALNFLKKQAIWQIYLPAPRRIVRPKFHSNNVNEIHQLDLLFLPHDTVGRKKYKYALTVVDIASRYKDAEPLSDKSSESVANALTNIYKRGPLTYPRLVHVDEGTEFKAHTTRLLLKHGVLIRRGIPGVHRAQAIVENFNKQLAERLFSYQYGRELQFNERNTEWVQRLRHVVKAMNEEKNMATGMKPVDAIKQKFIGSPVTPVVKNISEDSPMFQKKVRYLYEAGEAEGGNVRRATDPVWSTSVHEIKSMVPGNPTIYYLWDGPQRAFVKEELQIVPPDTVTKF